MARKFLKVAHTQTTTRTPEKDNEQCQRFHTRGATIAVQGTTIQVRASANGRGVRGENFEATKDTKKERLEGRDRGECERSRWCVVVRASCARRCGLRGYCDGQSTARARGGAKAAFSRVAGS